MKPLTFHWADLAAAKIIQAWGDKDTYTVASGITPSGTVHIGNFREVITVEFVAKALKSLGKNVRFIYSWDDFDTFRKVPKNLPNQDMLAKHLRRPISRVPDAYGETESYAAHNIKVFEAELEKVGIKPEFLYQHSRYADGQYAESMRVALQNKSAIKAILDEFRSTPLEESWLPTAIYCEKCDRDEMDYENYDGDWGYGYRCKSCGHETVTDIRKTKNLKLNWRTDWPMRWAFEKVEFEPGGKDHSSDGGSYDTAKRIVKEVWHRDPPQYLQYDFVSIKGGTGKMSSSSGELFTLSQAYEVYEPQMVRWIFASQRPNHDFSIAFDIDVIKTYEEFDRAEAEALGPAPAEDKNNKWQMVRRVYELACIGSMPSQKPVRASFRELCNRLQICSGDLERTWEKFYKTTILSPADRAHFQERARRALFWLEHYAPADFRYMLNEKPMPMDLSTKQDQGLQALKKLIQTTDIDGIDPKELNQKIYDDVIHGVSIDAKEFFTVVYRKLINRDQGPRLPGFIKEIGSEKLLELL